MPFACSTASKCTFAQPVDLGGERGQLEIVRREEREAAVASRASWCAIAQASARPSKVDVPRPISSISTRLCGVARCRMCRGFGHLDHERRAAAGEVVGRADARVDRVERTERRALAAGTNDAAIARAARSPRSAACRSTCRPCSGPVTISSRRSRREHEVVGDEARRPAARRPDGGRRGSRCPGAGDECGRAKSSASARSASAASTSSARERHGSILQRRDRAARARRATRRRAASRAPARAPAPTAPCPRRP